MASALRIGSLNVRGLGDSVKRKDVLDRIKDYNLSVLCLQDVHFKDDNIKLYEDEWGGRCIINAYTSESRGVAMMFKKDLELKVEDIEKDEKGNLLMVRALINGKSMLIITLYGPNKDTPTFYENIKHMISRHADLPVVVCGDWNLVLDQKKDTRGYKRENNVKSRQTVLDMMECLELVDVWRSLNPKNLGFTW